MAGHNKWSKIKHKKTSSDSNKSKVFSKISRLISLEARGGDRNAPGLRAAIEKARSYNIPMDTIERAIERGVQKNSENLEKVIYESYGPFSCAMLITVLTNNKNRSAAEVRHCLSAHNLSIAEPGAALWMFEQKNGAYVPKVPISVSKENVGQIHSIQNVLLDLEDVNEVVTNVII